MKLKPCDFGEVNLVVETKKTQNVPKKQPKKAKKPTKKPKTKKPRKKKK